MIVPGSFSVSEHIQTYCPALRTFPQSLFLISLVNKQTNPKANGVASLYRWSRVVEPTAVHLLFIRCAENNVWLTQKWASWSTNSVHVVRTRRFLSCRGGIWQCFGNVDTCFFSGTQYFCRGPKWFSFLICKYVSAQGKCINSLQVKIWLFTVCLLTKSFMEVNITSLFLHLYIFVQVLKLEQIPVREDTIFNNG